MTLFDLEQLGTNTDFNTNYNWAKSVMLSGLSMTTTLLAAWAKKKGFVKRIKDIEDLLGKILRVDEKEAIEFAVFIMIFTRLMNVVNSLRKNLYMILRRKI